MEIFTLFVIYSNGTFSYSNYSTKEKAEYWEKRMTEFEGIVHTEIYSSDLDTAPMEFYNE